MVANTTVRPDTKVTINLENAELSVIFKAIKEQTTYKFSYGEFIINNKQTYNVHFNNKNVNEVLSDLSQKAAFKYKIQGDKVIISSTNEELKSTQQQLGPIKGKITDETGQPLLGATVVEEGTNNGVLTDFDGNFSITLEGTSATLTVSYMGYKTYTISVANEDFVNISLELDSTQLNEVVVVGYGTVKKKDATGANSTIRGEDLITQSNVSVGSALQGTMSGLNVMSNSGYPGAEASLSVRGIGTFGSGDNSPLVVIDGMPIQGSGLESLNPNDIASVSVLKDAASAAIYGSRAANGVVIITTKEGKKGTATIEVNSTYGLQSAANVIDVLSAEEFVGAIQEMAANKKIIDGGDPITNYDGLDPASFGEGTKWSDHIYKSASTYNLNASVNGGSENVQYYVSGEFMDQEGIAITSAYQKASFRANLKAKVTPDLTVGNNLLLNYRNIKGDRGTRLSDVIFNAPIIPAYDPDGTYGEAPPQTSSKNAIPEVNWRVSNTDQYRVLNNFFVEYKILDKLKFRFNGGVDYQNTFYSLFSPLYNDGGQTNSENSLVEERKKEFMWVTDFLMYYNNTFNRHSIDLMAGTSRQLFQNDFMKGQVKGFVSEVENMQVINGSTNSQDIQLTGSKSELALASYFGRLNYEFDNRYLFTFNLRADGSSRFKGKNNRWGVFPSFAAGWKIDNENFFNSNTISDLKVRASWGQLGNQSIGSWYPTSSPLSSQKVVLGPGADQQAVYYGYSQQNLGNNGLEWETTTITNLGFDIGLWENRVNLTANYFRKNTEGVLRTMVLPLSVGMRAPNVNYAEVQNKGFELEATYRNTIKDFNYAVSGNISFIDNEIRKLSDGADEEILTAPYGGELINRVGEPINALYGYKTAGVITSQEEAQHYRDMGQGNAKMGRYKYVDNNNDGIIDANDKVILGSHIPKMTAGLTLSFNYKNFDFATSFIGVFGRNQHSPMSFQNRFPNRNISRKWYDNRWIPGTPAEGKYPALIQSESYSEMTDLMVSNTSFVKWKSVSIGYTFKLPKLKARVFVAGENLLSFTHKDFDGFDPENGNSYGHYTNWGGDYPTARVFITGLNLSF